MYTQVSCSTILQKLLCMCTRLLSQPAWRTSRRSWRPWGSRTRWTPPDTPSLSPTPTSSPSLTPSSGASHLYLLWEALVIHNYMENCLMLIDSWHRYLISPILCLWENNEPIFVFYFYCFIAVFIIKYNVNNQYRLCKDWFYDPSSSKHIDLLMEKQTVIVNRF